jgi:hypothetical protein
MVKSLWRNYHYSIVAFFPFRKASNFLYVYFIIAPKSQGEKNKDDVLPPESQREKKEDEIDEKDSIIDVPEYSFSIVDVSEKTSDNRYIYIIS